jgi:hypothetical protein
MGEVVGMAASVCRKQNATPRDVYEKHLAALQDLMRRGVGRSPEAVPDYENGGEGRKRSAKTTASALAPPKWFAAAGSNVARVARVEVSGSRDAAHPPALLNDGRLDLADNESRWISDAKPPQFVTFAWDEPREIGALRVVSGYRHANGAVDSPVQDFVLQYEQDGAWKELARVEQNERVDWSTPVLAVRTSRIRLEVTDSPVGVSRIWEIELYGPVKDGQR